jgi:heme/copper-type cytochrome/quinol oxidase subunit 2
MSTIRNTFSIAAMFIAAQQAHSETFNVSASSTAAFTINTVADPTLTLARGQTYQFQLVSLASIHPFWIKTTASTGTENAYNDGLSSNGQTGNVLMTFTVPDNAPDQLFYSCQTHAAMTGAINIVSNEALFSNGFE